MNIIKQYSEFSRKVCITKSSSLLFYPQQRQVNLSTFKKKKKGNKSKISSIRTAEIKIIVSTWRVLKHCTKVSEQISLNK